MIQTKKNEFLPGTGPLVTGFWLFLRGNDFVGQKKGQLLSWTQRTDGFGNRARPPDHYPDYRRGASGQSWNGAGVHQRKFLWAALMWPAAGNTRSNSMRGGGIQARKRSMARMTRKMPLAYFEAIWLVSRAPRPRPSPNPRPIRQGAGVAA